MNAPSGILTAPIVIDWGWLAAPGTGFGGELIVFPGESLTMMGLAVERPEG